MLLHRCQCGGPSSTQRVRRSGRCTLNCSTGMVAWSLLLGSVVCVMCAKFVEGVSVPVTKACSSARVQLLWQHCGWRWRMRALLAGQLQHASAFEVC